MHKFKDGIALSLKEGKGKLYHHGYLKFKGDGYVAIKTAISLSGDDPEIIDTFRAQLEMREKIRFNESSKGNKTKESQ